MIASDKDFCDVISARVVLKRITHAFKVNLLTLQSTLRDELTDN